MRLRKQLVGIAEVRPACMARNGPESGEILSVMSWCKFSMQHFARLAAKNRDERVWRCIIIHRCCGQPVFDLNLWRQGLRLLQRRDVLFTKDPGI